MLPEQQQRIMGYFIEEAKDHLNTIEQGLLSLQATIEDPEKANEMFRAAHSVKGGAAMLGLESIQTTAHRMEDYFKILKETSVQVDSTLETMFLRVSDGLKDLLEQLEGPFGLTPEKAQEIMADVDPVFGQLETHLESLVSAGGGEKGSAISPGSSSADALQVAFKKEVSTLLRQLLTTFKQSDNDESRRDIQEICVQLNSLGKQFELSAWCDLIETARLAAEERSNEYRVLAPILIKEIKKSQDLVLAGRASEVDVSDTMQALLPEDILATADTLENDVGSPEGLSDILFEEADSSRDDSDRVDSPDLMLSSLTDDASKSSVEERVLLADGLFDSDDDLFDADIDTSTEDLDELFGLSANSAESPRDDSALESTEEESIDPSREFSAAAVAAVESLPAQMGEELKERQSEKPASRLNIDLDFNEIPSELSALNRNADVEEKADESLDALLATVNVTGPDVGKEELNSLADLFDGDLEELDNTLGSHPFVSEEMRLHPERIDLEEDDDLTDLLADETSASVDSSNHVTATDEIEDDLFGGTLTEGGFADLSDLSLDEETDLGGENNGGIEDVSHQSLDAELANLAEDPWAEKEETNELEDLFGAGAESLTGSSDPGDVSVNDSASSAPDTVLDLEEEGESLFGENSLEENALEESDSKENSREESSLESLSSTQSNPDIESSKEGNPEADNLQTEDVAVFVQADVVNVSSDQSSGNLSSGLFAVESLSPSEQEIEFPTLTGAKLEEVEKDIDSFFDSPTNESETSSSDEDFDLLLTNDASQDEKENLLTVPSENQLSENPWGELAPDGKPPQNDQESTDFEPADFDLLAIDGGSDDADTTEDEDTKADVVKAEPISDLFDVESSFSPRKDSVIDLEIESETSQKKAIEPSVDEPSVDNDVTNDLWDDLLSEPVSDNSDDQPTESAEEFDIDISDLNVSDIESADVEPDIETVFSAEYVTESDLALDELMMEDALGESISDDAIVDESLPTVPAAEPSIQDLFETSEPEAISSEADLLELDNLFVEDEDSEKQQLTDSRPDGTSIVQELPSEESLLEEPLADGLVNDVSFAEAADIELSSAEKSAVSEDDFSTLSGLLDGFADDTVSDLSSDLSSDLALAQDDISSTSREVADEDALDFDDLESLLDDGDEQGGVESGVDASPTGSVQTESMVEDEEDFDDLERLLEDGDSESMLSAAPARRAAPRTPRRSNPAREQNMRVPVKHLDNLSNLVGELVVNRNTLERDQERLRQFLDNLLFQVQQLNDVGQRMRDLYERSLLESSLVSNRKAYAAGNRHQPAASENHATGATFDALEMDRFTGFHTLSQEMIELIVRVRESASDIGYTVESSDQVTRQFRQVTTQLQEGLNTARMVAFSQAADRLPRAVRDISLKCGKEARLIVEGKDTLIDKMIVEHLYDPLTHLVNNAITHGVETPEARKSIGKQPEGLITVQAFYQGNQTVIYVADDGGGINPEFVKRKAVEKKLITQAEADQLSDIEAYELIFHAGFSTRDQADDFAGRGVGMDVVRTSLAEIRGAITIDSELGKGTSFTIRLPLTLSISKALSCVSNQARIAFPMDGVEDMLDVPRDRIVKNEQEQDCVKWRDRTLPFHAVTDLLKFNRTLGRGRVYGGSQEDDVLSIIILRSANTFVAIQVDQVIGEEEIVIKQLEGPVPKPLGIAGATILGDGRVMPIADVLELIDIAMGRVRREPSSLMWAETAEAEVEETTTKTDPTVLIVDDSITVRELLSMSFNKVGYRVEQARDGQEAWDKLRSGLPCDLVFCDIEMPRMDGLELLSRMQKDHHLKSVPIAMLTSRGADRHRQMAVDLGASGYFTKPYLEEALLDAAQRMLNGETLAKGRGG